jgi:hypothetical protein
MDPRADRIRRAGQISHDLAVFSRGGSIDILKDDVCEIHAGRVGGALRSVDVEVALVQDDRVVGVLDADVLVRDVVDAAVADIGTGPCFETGAVLIVLDVDLAPRMGTLLTSPFSRVTFSTHTFSMISMTPGYWPIDPIDTPCVLLHQRFCTKTLVVLGLGEKQSSPISIRVLVTLRPLTLSVSKPSVFLGWAYDHC